MRNESQRFKFNPNSDADSAVGIRAFYAQSRQTSAIDISF